MPKLKEEYNSRIIAELEKKLGTTNKMLVPRLQKVVLNMGFGIVSKDEQKALVDDLTVITGQKPMLCRAKKSISNFKLREGMVIGAKVTLRGDRMWEFCERLINVALPRIRDFRGVPNRGFDGRGNYTLGLKDHSIFPEIVEAAGPNSGMDVTFVTTAQDNKAAKEFLVALGMPFAGRN
ncbi:MAG: 50S ribosomal protein L5 [bacterium]|nr:50S ribosomal protein L5 [bacterium]MDO5312976.1 50S ribosomal protein L5 [bacterium]